MDRNLALALTVGAGVGLAAQAPILAALGRDVGALAAAAISVSASTLVLWFAAVSLGGVDRLGAHPVAWHYVAGGLLGAAYVLTATVTVRWLGAAGMITALVAGQLVAAAVIDHLALLGVDRDPASPAKLAGLALVATGVALVTRT
ncbi:MAG: hypothetical protein AVDCRST_MAG79-1492 [uncultured Thermoleophilia bacterium]|uniref:Integral membrane protein n=1 Tax=uncultured Thermoleophilia bacterium TaxID=1497501 RepID=A0A6J4U2U9_9ACTN|nr:MAG: hypothetical protein AVDCRST_MAG79-1492 [uncultured Thermoleophilia bacterium]